MRIGPVAVSWRLHGEMLLQLRQAPHRSYEVRVRIGHCLLEPPLAQILVGSAAAMRLPFCGGLDGRTRRRRRLPKWRGGQRRRR
jgi:hypothetical protein